MKTEVLLTIMNCKSKEEYKKILISNQITGKVLATNQLQGEKITVNENQKRLISYNEIGASKNRNHLLENAEGDICIFADNDTVFVDNYESIIENEHTKNKDADIIVFYAENQNKTRERNKKIGNKKINKIDLMRVRTNEITIKKGAIEKIREYNIKFDTNFGPGSIFKKGEETVFIADLLNAGMKIYSVNKTIWIINNFRRKNDPNSNNNNNNLQHANTISTKMSRKHNKSNIQANRNHSNR